MATQDEDAPIQPLSVPETAPGGLRRIAPKPGQKRRLQRRVNSVRVLKIALPLVMVVTLGYLGYWWLESRSTVVNPELMQSVGESVKSEVTVNAVKYDGKDDRGRPFSITADSASHAEDDDRHISLKKPVADITLKSGSYVAVTANDGVLDRDSDIVTLTGNVTLFHDNGLSFQTNSATVDLKAKTAEGYETVEGQNGDGNLVSQGFRVLDDGDTIHFTGKAHMKIYPRQKGQDQNGQEQKGQGG
jgi:lipopolysaccharide export system protein LptC